MGAMTVALIVIGIFVLVLLLALVGIYNGLVTRRVQCREAWSQIDVQLKRRHDLIPNLVETVKGYATHERGTLEAVTAARGAAVSATGIKERAEAENMLTGALRQLLAVAEAYPNLKANENFARLQEELSSTENRISFSRQHYNDTAADYNMTVQKFPSNLIAGMFGFKEQEFFQLEDKAEKEVPQVKF
jgi:LemA protein